MAQTTVGEGFGEDHVLGCKARCFYDMFSCASQKCHHTNCLSGVAQSAGLDCEFGSGMFTCSSRASAKRAKVVQLCVHL